MINSIDEVKELGAKFYDSSFGKFPAPRPDVADAIRKMCIEVYCEGFIRAMIETTKTDETDPS